jgi:hypothetical protein
MDTQTYDEVDEALYEWYRWSRGYQEVHEHANSDATCRDFRASRQWMDYEDLSELVDYQLRKHKGELIDPIISTLGLQHRMAVNIAMRNMEVGYSVWKSGRHPDTQEQDYRDAKHLMLPKLIIKGVVNPKTVV